MTTGRINQVVTIIIGAFPSALHTSNDLCACTETRACRLFSFHPSSFSKTPSFHAPGRGPHSTAGCCRLCCRCIATALPCAAAPAPRHLQHSFSQSDKIFIHYTKLGGEPPGAPHHEAATPTCEGPRSQLLTARSQRQPVSVVRFPGEPLDYPPPHHTVTASGGCMGRHQCRHLPDKQKRASRRVCSPAGNCLRSHY